MWRTITNPLSGEQKIKLCQSFFYDWNGETIYFALCHSPNRVRSIISFIIRSFLRKCVALLSRENSLLFMIYAILLQNLNHFRESENMNWKEIRNEETEVFLFRRKLWVTCLLCLLQENAFDIHAFADIQFLDPKYINFSCFFF